MGVSRPPRRPSGNPAGRGPGTFSDRRSGHTKLIVLNNCTKHKEKTETNKKCGAEIKIARCGDAHTCIGATGSQRRWNTAEVML